MKTVAFAFLFLAASAGAQQIDARWVPWLGCWHVTGGTAGVCIEQADPNAVTMTTRVAGEPNLAHTVVADSAGHPTSELGCTGTQRAEWSADGRRLFTRADLTCKDQPSRKVSGLSLMTANDAWLDVQAVEIAGQTVVRVRRYQRAAAPVGRVLSGSAGVLLTLEAVKEAATRIAPEALEAALTETGSRFALNSRALVDLDEARVPGSVIDVMVALSYPDKFRVERRPEANFDSYPPAYLDAERAGFWGLGYPYDPFFAGYYGNYRYYASPFAYGAYSGFFGAYDPDYYYPRVVVPDNGATPAAPAEDARVVNGVGYTRVRPREAQKTDAGDEGRSNGSSSGRASAGTSGYSSGSTGSSSSGSTGSSSSGSSSSGSGSSDSGRTAQPR